MISSPNSNAGLKSPRFVVVHYTASPTFEGTKAWLCDKKSRVSAHLLIGRDGRCDQLVAFDRVAWHAGRSEYAGLTQLNKHSIGIELVALGPLSPTADPSMFVSPVYGTKVPASEVYHGEHPDTPKGGYKHWHDYTEPQLERLRTELSRLFTEFPSLERVIGHRDCARGRKLDPFPLNLASFQVGR